MNELLQSQIEVATFPCGTAPQARRELLHFRRTLARIGQTFGLGIVAAGSHPLSRPSQHKATNKRRYARIINELGMVGLGNALCALHVHVEVVEDRQLNSEFSSVTRALTEENRWRAQRYGLEGTYIDVNSRQAKPFRQFLDETLTLVKPDLIALNLETELSHLTRIVERGTSAHHQLGVFGSLRSAGVPKQAALRQLSLWLLASTVAGDFLPRPAPVSSSTLPAFKPEPVLMHSE